MNLLVNKSMANKQTYKPICCVFYDYIEEAATLKKASTIEYLEDNSVVQVESKIQTLVIKNKVEYMVLENGHSIRLDYLLSFNGKLLAKSR